MKMTISTSSTGEVLDHLEQGKISVEQAVQLLEALEGGSVRIAQANAKAGEERLELLGFWWLLPLTAGIFLTLLGGWLAWLGGLWWLLAAPSLALGLTSITLAFLRDQLPWANIRIQTGSDTWPRRIQIGFPFPVAIGAWALEVFGHWIPSMDRGTVEQLAYVLRKLDLKATPISVFVDEGQPSERVEIYIG